MYDKRDSFGFNNYLVAYGVYNSQLVLELVGFVEIYISQLVLELVGFVEIMRTSVKEIMQLYPN